MEMESISGSDHYMSGSAAAGRARGLRRGWQLISEFWISGRSEMRHTLTKITTKVKHFILNQGKPHLHFAFYASVQMWLMLCLPGMLCEHVCSSPAAQRFIFKHPRTLTPWICLQSTRVQHY